MSDCFLTQNSLARQASPQSVRPEWVCSTTDVHFLCTLQFLKLMLKWETLELTHVLNNMIIIEHDVLNNTTLVVRYALTLHCQVGPLEQGTSYQKVSRV